MTEKNNNSPDDNDHDEQPADHDEQPADLDEQLAALDLSDSARETVLNNWDSAAGVLAAGDFALIEAGLEPFEAATVIADLDAPDGEPTATDERPTASSRPREPDINGPTPGSTSRKPARTTPSAAEQNPQPDTPPAWDRNGSDAQVATETADDSVDPRQRNQESRAHRAGWSVGRAVMLIPRFLVTVLLGIARGVVGIIPKRSTIYQKIIKGGYKNLYKKTDAHVVVDTVYPDGERVPRPAEIDKEENKLKTANGEWWTVSNGLEKQFVGDTPVVTGVADHHETVDHVGARVAEAVDLGPSRYTTVEYQDNGVAPTNGGAVADGGSQLPGTTFDDVWLDVSNPEPENSGWIVSLRKHYEMHFDRAGSEEMERQETRGILSAQEPDDRSEWLKLLIFVGGLMLGLFGPALAGAIGGGGGGGSPVPGGLGTIAALTVSGVMA